MALRDYMQDLMRTQNASEISLINDNSSSSIPESSSLGGNSGSSFFNLGSNSNHSNYSNYSNTDLSVGDVDNFDGHGSFSSLGESSHTLLKRDEYNDNPDTDEDAIYNDSMGSEDSFFFASEDSTSDEVLIESIRIRRKGGRRSSVRQMMQLPGDDDGTNDNDELGLALQGFRDRHRRLRESLHNSSLHGYSPTSKLSPITTTSQSTPPTRNTTTTTGIDSSSGGENNLRSRLAQLSINNAAGGGSDLLE
jgi:hypothetical protein